VKVDERELARNAGHYDRCSKESEEVADLIGDGATAYFIERALDEARSQQFRPEVNWTPADPFAQPQHASLR
jgi:hypothetical protein